MPSRAAEAPNELLIRLSRLRSTLRRRLLLHGCCAVAAGGVCATLTIVALDWLLGLPAALRIVVGALFVLGFALATNHWIVRPLRAPLTLDQLAVHLDHHFHGLNDRLTSFVQFLRSRDDDSPSLRARMIANTRQIVERIPLAESLTLRPLLTGAALAVGSGTALAVVLAFQPVWMLVGVTRYLDPFGAAAWPARVEIVDPNRDAVIAFGDSHALIVRIVRGDTPRLRPLVHVDDGEGGRSTRALNRQANGAYTCTLERLTATARIWFEAGDAHTRDRARTLRVVRPPTVTRALAHVHAPAYAAHPHVRTFDLASATPRVVAGSRVELELTISTPPRMRLGVPDATLQVNDDEPLLFTADPTDARQLRAFFEAHASSDFSVRVVDAHGFANRETPQWRIEVAADQPPAVVLRAPPALEMTPAAELRVAVEVVDDLGLSQLALVVQPEGGQASSTHALPFAAHFDASSTHIVAQGNGAWRVTDLPAAPGNVFSLRACAYDNLPGAQGQVAWSAPVRLTVIDSETLQRQERERIRHFEQTLRNTALAIEQLAERTRRLNATDAGDASALEAVQHRITGSLRDVSRHAGAAAARLADNGARSGLAYQQAQTLVRELQSVIAGPLQQASEGLDAAARAAPSAMPSDIAAAQQQAAAQLLRIVRELGRWDDFAAAVEQVRGLLDRQQAARRDHEGNLASSAGRDSKTLDSQARMRTAKDERTQRLIAEDAEQLLADMRKTVADASRPPEHRDALSAALRAATASDLLRALFDAAETIARDQSHAARIAQRSAEVGLSDMLTALAAQRQRQLVDLARELADAANSVERLSADLAALRDATRETLQQGGQHDEWDVLGDRQYTLAGNVRQLADHWQKDHQLRQHAVDLAEAHAPLQGAAAALYNGAGPTALEQQNAASAVLERLLELFRREAEQAREDAETQRMNLVQTRLAGLHKRQSDMNQAGAELIALAGQGEPPSRALARKAAALGEDQGRVAADTAALRDELQDVALFQYCLDRAVDRMTEARGALAERRLDDSLANSQERAAGELAVLLRALTDLRDLPDPDSYARRDASGGGSPGDMAEAPPVPALAELLVLKAMQVELNARTAAHAERFDAESASEAELLAMRELAAEQQTLGELAQKLLQEARAHAR